MDKIEYVEILKNAHQKYIDWWLPIDVAKGSIMAPMAFNRFCDSLLLYNDDWFDSWLGDKIPKDKRIPFKVYILKYIKNNYE